jgi:hypothetical protein
MFFTRVLQQITRSVGVSLALTRQYDSYSGDPATVYQIYTSFRGDETHRGGAGDADGCSLSVDCKQISNDGQRR